MAKDYGDLPFEEAYRRAKYWISQGCIIFQKFTCEKCGQRLTMEMPNVFYRAGSCDKCGHITQIDKCGFIVMVLL
jgi:hypothetical protein